VSRCRYCGLRITADPRHADLWRDGGGWSACLDPSHTHRPVWWTPTPTSRFIGALVVVSAILLLMGIAGWIEAR
jgi:hypothetical protein